MPVAEQVDARPLRRAGRQRPLRVQPPHPRRREVDEVGDGAGTALLRQADQMHERLGGRLRIRQRAMTGLRRRAEEVGERGEADTLRPAFEQPPREPDGVDDRGSDAPASEPLDLDVEEPEVEARVVRDEDGVAGEVEEAADDLL